MKIQRNLGLSLSGIFVLLMSVTQTSAKSSLTDIYDKLFTWVTIISAVVLLLVLVLFFLFISKFREGNEVTERKPISHSGALKLETMWTVATILIVIALMVVSYPPLFQLDDLTTTDADSDATVVIIEGTGTWTWRFHIPSLNQTYEPVAEKAGDFTIKRTNMTLEVGVEYKFIFWSSSSLIHSFYAPDLNFKMDAVPGSNNSLVIKILEQAPPGGFEILCTEFCGTGHSFMRGVIFTK